jgi:hypothetical protein
VPNAAAESAVGIVEGTRLLARFDTAHPGVFTEVKSVTGIGIGERLEDLDYRWHPNGELNPVPAPQLYALAVKPGLEYRERIYTIDPATGAATPVGADFSEGPAGFAYGIDFNPVSDRLRVVNDSDGNFRVNPDTGAIFKDTALNPAGQKITGVAYSGVEIPTPPADASKTTGFAIGATADDVYNLGGPAGQPPSANTGALLNGRPLGVGLPSNARVGFDIAPSGTAFATLDPDGTQGLYTIDLATGAATLVGKLPEILTGLAVVPTTEAPRPTPVVPPDRTPPTVSLAGVRSSMPLASFLKGISIQVTANEAAGLEAELLAAAKSAKLASFNLILASTSLSLATGQRTLNLKPNRRLIGKPAKKFKVSLRVTATDAAGNAATASKTITVKPAAKKKKTKRR